MTTVQFNTKIGPSFLSEITAAGLLGAPFGWSEDGRITDYEQLSLDQQNTLQNVIKNHDPTKSAPPELPKSVHMWQAKAILQQMGLLDKANNAVNGSGDQNIIMAWTFAPEISRDSPAVAAMGTLIGLTSQDIDNLFLQADAIKV